MSPVPPVRLAPLALLSLLAAPVLAQSVSAPDESAQSPSTAPTSSLARDVEELKLMVETLSAGAEQGVKEPPLRIYGFADAGINKLFTTDNGGLNTIVPSTATTFVIGNLNLFFDAQPSEDWSALIETRLTNHPRGQSGIGPPGQPLGVSDNRTFDFTSPSPWANIHLGAIVIERAYLQWRQSDLLKVRVGIFLTPFGIWNMDHGTPTLISLMLPQMEVNEMFPTQQVGIEALGMLPMGEWELGYFAYLSNGRQFGQLDPTEDKMVGGRLYGRTSVPMRMQYGVSFFSGNYSEETRTVKSLVPYRTEEKETVAYGEKGVGVDASLDLGPVRLRGELAYSEIRYQTGKRGNVWNRPDVFPADSNVLDGYLLAAYRLPMWGLEPFAYAEFFRWPSPLGEGMIIGSVGLNIHFTPAVQLKLQYLVDRHYEKLSSFTTGVTTPPGTKMLAARLVLAF